MNILYTITGEKCPTTQILLTQENGKFVYSTEDGQTYIMSKPLKTKEEFVLLLTIFGRFICFAGYSEESGTNELEYDINIEKETL